MSNSASVHQSIRSCLGAVICCLATQSVIWAYNSIDGIATDPKSGLTIRVQSDGIGKTGYRPLEVTVTRRGALMSDRNIVIIFTPHAWNPFDDNASRVRSEFELSQGVASTTGHVLIPQSGYIGALEMEVFADGKHVEALDTQLGTSTASAYITTETYPGWWFIDSDFDEVRRASERGGGTGNKLPNVQALVDLMPLLKPETTIRNNRTENPVDAEIVNDLKKLALVNMTDFDVLPENWLEYSCYDLVVISLDDLQKLRLEHRSRFETLLRFVRMGGNMIVYGTGEKGVFLRQNELDQLLGFRSEEDSAWQQPSSSNYDRPISSSLPQIDYYYSGGRYISQSEYTGGADPDTEEQEAGSDQLNRPPKASFQLCELGLGRVVAISASNPFRYRKRDDRGIKQWNWILRSLGTERWKWYQRHGLSMNRNNDHFFHFAIKGVGAAPVVPFLVMITCFVFCIGPVNYVLLNRWKRLYLILFTVPLAAGLVTIALIAFAFLDDGFSVRMRIRSFTLLDRPSGEALCWSRQAYYSGLPVSDGLTFPASAAVYPIKFTPNERRSSGTLLAWNGDQQKLARGYIGARTLAQMLVCQPSPYRSQVEIRAANDGLHAINRLATDIDYLLVSDPRTKSWFYAESLSSGQATELRPISEADARKKNSILLERHRPVVEPNMTFQRGRRRTTSGSLDSNEDGVMMGTSILETAIDELRLRNGASKPIYFAVTEKAHEFVPHGVAASAEEDAFHVIKGSWSPTSEGSSAGGGTTP